MRTGWAVALPLVMAVSTPIKAATPVVAGTAARNAKAAFVYYSQATQNAALRPLDAALIEQRKRADALGAKLAETQSSLSKLKLAASASRKEVAALEAQLAREAEEAAAAREAFTTQLAAKDAAYASELAILRRAADDILSTPEGLKYLEANNSGDLAAADAIEEKLIAARQKMRDLQAAADRRAFARVAFDNWQKGRRPIKAVISRFEEVTRLDPGNYGDWSNLAYLYVTAGQDAQALDAAARSEALAQTIDQRLSPVALRLVVLMRQSRFDEGVALAREALRQIEIDKAAASDVKVLTAKASLQRQLALLLVRSGDLAAAIAAHQDAVASTRQVLGFQPGSPAAREALSEGLAKLGGYQVQAGQHDAALAALEESIVLRTGLVAQFPEYTRFKLGLAATLGEQASLFSATKRFAAAAANADRMIEILEPIQAQDPTALNTSEFLLYSYLTRGVALYKARQLGDAQLALEKAVELGNRLRSQDRATGSVHNRYLALSCDYLGRVLFHKDEYPAALDKWNTAISLHNENASAAESQVSVALVQSYRAWAFERLGDSKSAGETYLVSLRIAEKVLEARAGNARARQVLITDLFGLARSAIPGFSQAEVDRRIADMVTRKLIDGSKVELMRKSRSAEAGSEMEDL